jgi:hypothetical protein
MIKKKDFIKQILIEKNITKINIMVTKNLTTTRSLTNIKI